MSKNLYQMPAAEVLEEKVPLDLARVSIFQLKRWKDGFLALRMASAILMAYSVLFLLRFGVGMFYEGPSLIYGCLWCVSLVSFGFSWGLWFLRAWAKPPAPLFFAVMLLMFPLGTFGGFKGFMGLRWADAFFEEPQLNYRKIREEWNRRMNR